MKKRNLAIALSALVLSLTSCSGAIGPVGPAGPQGPQGDQGIQGQPGVDGEDGKNGVDGEDGKDGVDGEDGKDGQDGLNGSDGKTAYANTILPALNGYVLPSIGSGVVGTDITFSVYPDSGYVLDTISVTSKSVSFDETDFILNNNVYTFTTKMVENGFVVKAVFQEDIVFNTINEINDLLSSNPAYKTVHETITFLEGEGYSSELFNATIDESNYYFDLSDNKAVYLNKDGGTIYPLDYVGSFEDCYAVVGDATEKAYYETKGTSIYLENNYLNTENELSFISSFDVGNNNLNIPLTYLGEVGKTKDVLIRTNKDNLIINNATDQIDHQGAANKVLIKKTANNSYHENGSILSELVINEGKVVLGKVLGAQEEKGVVKLVKINLIDNTKVVTLENNLVIEEINISAAPNTTVSNTNINITSNTNSEVKTTTVQPEIKDSVSVDEIFTNSEVKPTEQVVISEINNETELKAIVNGGNYILKANIELNSIITLNNNKKVTLDLNEKTIDFKGNSQRPFVIPLTSDLIIRNGVSNRSDLNGGGIVSSNVPLFADNLYSNYVWGIFKIQGNLIIHGGYYSDKGADGALLRVYDNATLTIYGGTFACEFSNSVLNSEGKCEIYNGLFTSTASNRYRDSAGGLHAYTVRSSNDLTIHNATIRGIQGGLAFNGGVGEVYNVDVEVKDTNYELDNRNTSHYALYVAGGMGVVDAKIYGGSYKSSGVATICIGNATPGDGGITQPANLTVFGGMYDKLPQVGALNTKLITGSAGLGKLLLSGGKYFADPLTTESDVVLIANEHEVSFQDPYYEVVKI
ncbi:MAG TPA: hypothetical protein VJY64_00305 [Candidatus Onthovivens sp.]|nr:hypothetical protein [Candidatus Onthovivens sp.]